MTTSHRSAALLGIGLMLAGILLFSINDAQGKWLVATYSVGQLLLIRSAAALVVLAPFMWREGKAGFLSAPRPGLQLIRIALSAAEVSMFFLAVRYLPLADTMTFYLAGPIYVTALSALLLGEHVGIRRWTAVIVGFIGVLIALNPSPATLTGPALIALTGSVFFAFLMIATRSLRETPNTVLISGQIFATLLLGAVTAPIGWVTPSAFDFLMFCAFGVIGLVAIACVNHSLKVAPASVVVPYQYTMIVWGAIFGYLVFGDVPAPNVFVGAAIIIAAGLYIFVREQARARAPTIIEPP